FREFFQSFEVVKSGSRNAERSLEKLDPPSREARLLGLEVKVVLSAARRLRYLRTIPLYSPPRYSHRGSSIKLGCLVALQLRVTVVSTHVPLLTRSARLGSIQPVPPRICAA
ncbi:hypothetical protein ALC56_13234, partial [Trachymyrmex septentrionalis]